MESEGTLPGLVAQEYRSLNEIVRVYFMMYFDSQKKHGEADHNVAKTLFEMCSRVLRDYVQIQSEIFAIASSKEEQKQNSQGNRSGDVENSSADVDDDEETDGPESDDNVR